MPIDWQSISHCVFFDGNVAAAWIFCSAQGGAVRPGGDIDVGVLFFKKPLLDEPADLRALLQNALTHDISIC